MCVVLTSFSDSQQNDDLRISSSSSFFALICTSLSVYKCKWKGRSELNSSSFSNNQRMEEEVGWLVLREMLEQLEETEFTDHLLSSSPLVTPDFLSEKKA